MKTDQMTLTKNKLNSNQEMSSTKVEIGDADLILSYMRKESYKFHLRTAIQEYMSNALDAHREVGQTRKVEVTAPTINEPIFMIKDFGPGISPDRMTNVFCQVGVSTKRKNNSQKGGFGAGSKTLWAYTDMFSIITVVDGFKYHYNATVARSVGGEVILMGEPQPTIEPNGTEFQAIIKPQDIEKARDAIQRFCFFCEANEMPKVKNMPKFNTVHNQKISLIGTAKNKMESVFVLSNPDDIPHSTLGTYNNRSCILVLDGIPYPCDEEYSKILSKCTSILKGTLVLKFKTGILRPQLSREGIMVCDQNTSAISGIAKLIEKNIESEISEELKDSNDVSQFIKNFKAICEKYIIKSRDFKGFTFQAHGTINSLKFNSVTVESRTKTSYRKTITKDKEKKSIQLNDNLFYAEMSLESEAKVGRRINEFLLDNKSITVIKNYQGVDNPDFKDIKFVFSMKSIHDIEPERVEKMEVSKKVKAKESANLHLFKMYSNYSMTEVTKSVSNVFLDDLDKTKTYLYFNLSEYGDRRKSLPELITFFKNEEFTICAIGQEDLDKITKNDIKSFIHLDQYFKDYKKCPKDLSKLIHNGAKFPEFALLLNTQIQAQGKLKNKLLNTMMSYYKTYVNHGVQKETNIPIPAKVQQVYKNDKDLELFLSLDAEFGKLMKEELPMIKFTVDKVKFDESRKLDVTLKTDLIEYLNWKLK